jgi:hypothetical protein
VVAADEDNWFRLMNQFPSVDGEYLRQAFLDCGRNIEDTVRYLAECEKRKRQQKQAEEEELKILVPPEPPKRGFVVSTTCVSTV